MKSFRSAIVGMKFNAGAPECIARLRSGAPLFIAREPGNQYDKNAVAVWSNPPGRDGAIKLGFIPRSCNATIAKAMDAAHVAIIVAYYAPGIEPALEFNVGE